MQIADPPFRWDLLTPDQLGALLSPARRSWSTSPARCWPAPVAARCSSPAAFRRLTVSFDADRWFAEPEGPRRERVWTALAEAAGLVALGRDRHTRALVVRTLTAGLR